MQWLFDPQAWLALACLSALEIVLGIDNLVFLAILSERLPEPQRPLGERLGIGLALAARLGLLGITYWVSGLVEPVAIVFGQPVSWRDVILVAGGVFLLAKATHEIHGALEGDEGEPAAPSQPSPPAASAVRLWPTVIQMVAVDVVFSLDSIATAVGMADQFWVMAAAVVVAMALMLAAAAPLSAFLSGHPTIRILALAFVLMVGMVLVADGLGLHLPKGYLYFAMGLATAVEAVNLMLRRRNKPVELRHPVP